MLIILVVNEWMVMPSPTQTLSLDETLAVSRSMFLPTGEDLIGLECEWPARDWRSPNQRPTLETLDSIASTPLPGGGRVTIEPGGQVELSSYPVRGVSSAIDQVNQDANEVHGRLLGVGLDFEVRAIERSRPPERILRKPRYCSMEAFFDARNPVGRWMMCNTASLQVNISHDIADPAHRWYTLNRVAPALVAMFANSRGSDAAGQRWESLRQGIWMSMDPSRTAPVRLDIPHDEAWLEYALDADVMYICDDGERSTQSGRAPGLSFRSWMEHGCDVGYPTAADLRYHFSTLFPPVRARGWLELRVLDALPSWMRTAAALTVATIARQEISEQVCSDIPDLSGLHVVAARDGFANDTVASAVRTLTRIVTENAHMVTGRSDHLDALYGFIARYTSNGISPGHDSYQQLPVVLENARSAAAS